MNPSFDLKQSSRSWLVKTYTSLHNQLLVTGKAHLKATVPSWNLDAAILNRLLRLTEMPVCIVHGKHNIAWMKDLEDTSRSDVVYDSVPKHKVQHELANTRGWTGYSIQGWTHTGDERRWSANTKTRYNVWDIHREKSVIVVVAVEEVPAVLLVSDAAAYASASPVLVLLALPAYCS